MACPLSTVGPLLPRYRATGDMVMPGDQVLLLNLRWNTYITVGHKTAPRRAPALLSLSSLGDVRHDSGGRSRPGPGAGSRGSDASSSDSARSRRQITAGSIGTQWQVVHFGDARDGANEGWGDASATPGSAAVEPESQPWRGGDHLALLHTDSERFVAATARRPTRQSMDGAALSASVDQAQGSRTVWMLEPLVLDGGGRQVTWTARYRLKHEATGAWLAVRWHPTTGDGDTWPAIYLTLDPSSATPIAVLPTQQSAGFGDDMSDGVSVYDEQGGLGGFSVGASSVDGHGSSNAHRGPTSGSVFGGRSNVDASPKRDPRDVVHVGLFVTAQDATPRGWLHVLSPGGMSDAKQASNAAQAASPARRRLSSDQLGSLSAFDVAAGLGGASHDGSSTESSDEEHAVPWDPAMPSTPRVEPPGIPLRPQPKSIASLKEEFRQGQQPAAGLHRDTEANPAAGRDGVAGGSLRLACMPVARRSHPHAQGGTSRSAKGFPTPPPSTAFHLYPVSKQSSSGCRLVARTVRALSHVVHGSRFGPFHSLSAVRATSRACCHVSDSMVCVCVAVCDCA